MWLAVVFTSFSFIPIHFNVKRENSFSISEIKNRRNEENTNIYNERFLVKQNLSKIKDNVVGTCETWR